MPAIRPFCALRYNPEVVSDLSHVLSPPYDVIGSAEQEQLYQASPYNIVRLILGKQDPGDTETDNRYTRAHRDYDAWRSSRVLQPDPVPAIYLLEQTFPDGGSERSRLGFIALMELGDGVERTVYRHEATLEAPKQDRTKLLDAVPATLEPIFCLYPDAGGEVQGRLQGLTTHRAPTVQAVIKDGTIRVWLVEESDALRGIVRHLASAAVLIADGHHRFEVAYANRHRYGTLMTYFVSMADPSLVIRSIHRIVPYSADESRLRELCRLERAADIEAVMTWLRDEPGEGCFGYFDGQSLYRVRLHPERLASWLAAPSVPAPLAALDVSLLHELVLPRVSKDRGVGRCTYAVEASQAVRAVQQGEGRAVWLMRGIPLSQVYALASQGFSLPPKSTFFYPKVPSGVTINPLT